MRAWQFIRPIYPLLLLALPPIDWGLFVWKFHVPMEIGILVGIPIGIASGMLAWIAGQGGE